MIIHNATIITWENPNRVLQGYALRLENDRIAEIDKVERLLKRFPLDEMIDAKGQLLMPGLICAHTHFYGLFSRGMAIHGEAPAYFIQILEKLWWPLDQSLLEEDIYYSALISAVDAIKHGTTTVFDHHASPNAIPGSLDIIEKATRRVGLRASLCYEVTDRGGAVKTNEGIEENLRMIEKTRGNPPGSLVTAMFGLHAGMTVSDDTLKKAKNAIQNGYGFHIHVAEHQSDEFISLNRHGKRVIDRLDECGITGPESIFVHGVHLDTKEMELIRESGTWLTHQPRSNMNNAVGMANVAGAIRYGIPVCMGNDGFSFAMWDEWRTCYLAHKQWNRDPKSMPGDLVIVMGAINNSTMASHFFKDKIGKIEVGGKADLILVDYQPITEMHEGNLPWHILFGFRDSMVTTTIIDGKIVMKDRVIEGIDEKEISQQARMLSKGVWKRYQDQF